MLTGIGIDIVDIDRIAEVAKKWGDPFLHKVFTPAEIAYCSSKPAPMQHFAVRFAAKEAFAKAIATGWDSEFRWHDVEIDNNRAGKPELILHGSLQRKYHQSRIHLSLSHTHASAAAMVTLESAE